MASSARGFDDGFSVSFRKVSSCLLRAGGNKNCGTEGHHTENSENWLMAHVRFRSVRYYMPVVGWQGVIVHRRLMCGLFLCPLATLNAQQSHASKEDAC